MKIKQWGYHYGLSGKLLLLFIIMAVLFVLLVGGSLRIAFHSHFKTNIRPHLMQYLEYVQQDLGNPPNRQRAEILANRLGIEMRIFDAQGSWSSSGEQVNLDEFKIKHHFKEGEKEFFLVEQGNTDIEYMMMQHHDTTLLFNVPHVEHNKFALKLYFPLLVVLLILVILYYATRRLFRPIETIQEGVKCFGAGQFDHRITVRRRDELGVLATNFNAMAEDIQQMLDAKRQLLLAVSHELRTPLTRMKVAAELLADEKPKDRLKSDLTEMETLIEEIIEIERLSVRHQTLNKDEVDVGVLLLDLEKKFYATNSLQFELPDQPVIISADIARLKLLFKNLIDNALRFTPTHKPPPLIRVSESRGRVVIEVHDKGSGIRADNIPRLTEPFYRVDPSRQRDTGGYGLGLYLCKMIVEAHGGELVIESELNRGTTVRVELLI